MSKNVCITRLQNLLRDSSFPNVKREEIMNSVKQAMAERRLTRIDKINVDEVAKDAASKIKAQKIIDRANALNDEIIATAMFGYDGHRGWLNYFAVLPNFQKRGFGRQLMTYGEMALIERGCPKLNLQIRNDNTKAINFYQKVGYKEDAAVSFGKRLIED